MAVKPVVIIVVIIVAKFRYVTPPYSAGTSLRVGLPASRFVFSASLRRNLKVTRPDDESSQRFQSPTDVLIRTVPALLSSDEQMQDRPWLLSHSRSSLMNAIRHDSI